MTDPLGPLLAQDGPSKFCGEGLMLRAERTWRERYLRVTRVTPLTFYPEWMVQVADQGAGVFQVHGGLSRAFARNYVRRNSLDYAGLPGEGSIPGSLPPPAKIRAPYLLAARGPKFRGFTDRFCSGEFSGRLHFLSIGVGECVFLRNLRTSSGSPILNLPEAKAGLGRLITNPSPSTNVWTAANAVLTNVYPSDH